MDEKNANELRRLLDEAFKAFESGNDERSRRLCREALAIDPESSTAHSLMGLLYAQEGRSGEAAEEYQKVVERNPSSDAERHTLRRIRGDYREAEQPLPDEESAASRHRGLYLASAAALMVFVIIFLGLRYMVARSSGGSDGEAVAATPETLNDDLDLAIEAFNQGRYDQAMMASQRVLQADPTNAKAREIYQKSDAFLKGTSGAPVVSPRTNAPSATVPPVTPSYSPVPQVVPVPPPGTQMATGGGVTRPTAGGTAGPMTGVIVPVTPPSLLRDYSQPGTQYSPGRSTRQTRVVRPTVPGYDLTAGSRPTTRGGGLRPRQTGGKPSAPPLETIEPPSSSAGNDLPDSATADTSETGTSGTGSGGGSIRVEVHRRDNTTSGGPAPEVTPDLSNGGGGGQASGAEQPVDPAVLARQEQQRKLREARERQRLMELRRSQTEHGQ